MDNIYKTKLKKILEKYKNRNIYIHNDVKSLTDNQTHIFKKTDELNVINDKSIIVTNVIDNEKIINKLITMQCVLIMLLSIKKDNLNDLIKRLNTTCVDIFSWHNGDKHDEYYFVIFQNE